MKALITGGDGDIAKAIATQLKGLGWEVDAPDVNELDVTDIENVRDYLSGKKYDLIINNAGIIFPDNMGEADESKWVKTIQVNLIGTFYMCNQALKNGNPKIINIASTSGLKGRAGWSSYCASKAGVISLTESMVAEGIDAHVVIPRRTDTKMRNALFPNEDKSTLDTVDDVANKVIELL